MVLALAEELQLQVIAEGVETTDQLALLTTMGYALIQGYVFAKPMPEAALVAWLQDHQELGGMQGASSAS